MPFGLSNLFGRADYAALSRPKAGKAKRRADSKRARTARRRNRGAR